MTIRARWLGLGLSLAVACAGAGAAVPSIAAASCNPNTGCLPRPTDVMEVGGQYVVRPKTLDIVQTRSAHIYATGLTWSRWTGGDGLNGLIAGSARGVGRVHVAGTGSDRRAWIYLSRVSSGGANAFTYYDKMTIRGDPGVATYWTWHMRSRTWRP
jgi:hypothetical protein